MTQIMRRELEFLMHEEYNLSLASFYWKLFTRISVYSDLSFFNTDCNKKIAAQNWSKNIHNKTKTIY